jgi:hypothetical protein
MKIGRNHKVVAIALGLLLYVVSVVVSFVVGEVIGNGQAYHNRYLEEEPLLAQLISQDKDFRDLRVYETSTGFACLEGEVGSREAYERLGREVTVHTPVVTSVHFASRFTPVFRCLCAANRENTDFIATLAAEMLKTSENHAKPYKTSVSPQLTCTPVTTDP